jgi:hypothetical protein
MTRKPLSLRTAVITSTAMATGSVAGTLAEAIAQHLGCAHPGIGQLVTAITALWMLDKLNALIES